MVDGSKVTSMIIMIIIGLIIIILGGIVIWKYRQDQILLQSLVANGSLTQSQLTQFPSAAWTYGLAIFQIILGLILIIWGVVQYFANSKHIEAVKEYVSRGSSPVVVAPVVAPMDMQQPLLTETRYTGGSRRPMRV